MTEAVQTENSLLRVEVQQAITENDGEEPPAAVQLTAWAQHACATGIRPASELTIRLVDRSEMTALNREYRGRDKPTNVLAFPFEVDPDIDIALLGDIVICHAVVVEQARDQGKSVAHHYAHMVTHGVLHLCGYDHQEEDSARQMEAIEIQLLAQQGIADPYLDHPSDSESGDDAE